MPTAPKSSKNTPTTIHLRLPLTRPCTKDAFFDFADELPRFAVARAFTGAFDLCGALGLVLAAIVCCSFHGLLHLMNIMFMVYAIITTTVLALSIRNFFQGVSYFTDVLLLLV